MLSLSACSTPSKKATPEEPRPTKTQQLNCEELCEGTGRGAICPDPQTGATNCCWLMAQLHPCCEDNGVKLEPK